MEISIIHYQSRWTTDSGTAILIFESADETCPMVRPLKWNLFGITFR